MPTPAAATSFTLTPLTTGSAGVTLTWSHTGTDLDRFLVLYRPTSSSPYKKLVIAPKADFGAGPYSLVTATGEDFRWKVVAIGTGGERSVTNPTADMTSDIDGTWLLPLARGGGLTSNTEAWIGASHPGEDRERDFALFSTPFNKEDFSQSGPLHLRTGEIRGLLMDRFSVTGQGWLTRLRDVISKQRLYERVVLASPRDFFPVELTTGYRASPTIAGGQAWEVSVPYRELKR